MNIFDYLVIGFDEAEACYLAEDEEEEEACD